MEDTGWFAKKCWIRYAERIIAIGRAVSARWMKALSTSPEVAPGPARYAERILAIGREILLACQVSTVSQTRIATGGTPGQSIFSTTRWSILPSTYSMELYTSGVTLPR